MSWCDLPELEAAFSRSSFSDIKSLEQSRSRHIAALFCCRDREISACRSSRSGTTSRRSGLTIPSAPPSSSTSVPSGTTSASAEDFLVRIYRRAEKVAESPEQNPDSGTKWRALSVKFSPRLSLLKTARCSPRADSKPFLRRWPRWGMMRDGACWALDTSDTPLSETASGYWGNISCTMAGWMSPGTKKEPLLRATYGAQKQSLVCTMLRSKDCWPTALLCERLMGWPDHWSRSEPLATARYRTWLLSHGGSSLAA